MLTEVGNLKKNYPLFACAFISGGVQIKFQPNQNWAHTRWAMANAMAYYCVYMCGKEWNEIKNMYEN